MSKSLESGQIFFWDIWSFVDRDVVDTVFDYELVVDGKELEWSQLLFGDMRLVYMSLLIWSLLVRSSLIESLLMLSLMVLELSS